MRTTATESDDSKQRRLGKLRDATRVNRAERRARWGGDVIPEGFIRMSAGCEDHRDIIEDLSQALDNMSG